ncbi:hypothetical protein U0E18_31830, partial [Burkholderia pseudomallei]
MVSIRARARVRSVLLAGASIAAALVAVPARAQDGAPAPAAEQSREDQIVVTGIRETIQTSIQSKRDADAIVDAV